MSAALTKTQLIEKEETKLVIKTIKDTASNLSYGLDRAFESLFCSCQPQREEMERLTKIVKDREDAVKQSDIAIKVRSLEVELRAANAELQVNLNEVTHHSPEQVEITRLTEEVRVIDRQEHPNLNSLARAASPFMQSWLLARYKVDGAKALSEVGPDLQKEFAIAWQSGWRPGMEVESTKETEENS